MVETGWSGGQPSGIGLRFLPPSITKVRTYEGHIQRIYIYTSVIHPFTGRQHAG